MMPRRNRNAHAPAIDTDELAAQAAQLTAELGSVHIPILRPAGEIQLRLCGTPGTGKSAALINDLIQRLQQHPGAAVALLDSQNALAMGVTGHGR
jgi:putative protein kinase ArgK-like GTPase of G3E family